MGMGAQGMQRSEEAHAGRHIRSAETRAPRGRSEGAGLQDHAKAIREETHDVYRTGRERTEKDETQERTSALAG